MRNGKRARRPEDDGCARGDARQDVGWDAVQNECANAYCLWRRLGEIELFRHRGRGSCRCVDDLSP